MVKANRTKKLQLKLRTLVICLMDGLEDQRQGLSEGQPRSRPFELDYVYCFEVVGKEIAGFNGLYVSRVP